MEWTYKQINLHRQAASSLVKIIKEAFDLIQCGKLKTEFDIRELIFESFRKYKLITGSFPPHVAFGRNTSFVEYFPSQYSLKFTPRNLVMIDIEAKVNHPMSPFADVTWTKYIGGKPPKKMMEVFNIVMFSRNKALSYLRACLKRKYIPTGKEVDSIVRGVITDLGYGSYFNHRAGHSLGVTKSHGSYGNIINTNNEPLKINLGYTLEPGIYLPGKYGFRSEINFFINKNREVVITTPQQKTLSL